MATSPFDSLIPTTLKRIGFTVQGIQTIARGHQKVFYGNEITGILMRMHTHCDSDADVWAALMSGCLRDQSISLDTCTWPVPDCWWLPAYELPTLDLVVKEWEEAMVSTSTPRAAESEAERETVRQIQERVLETLNADIDNAADMLASTQGDMAGVGILLRCWEKVMRRGQ